jgi:hypothetical protein
VVQIWLKLHLDLGRQGADHDVDASLSQCLDALASDVLVRVFDTNEDPNNTRLDDCCGARPCAARVTARFESGGQRGPGSVTAGSSQRTNFGVCAAGRLCCADVDGAISCEQRGADPGVRSRRCSHRPCRVDRVLH